MSKRRVRNDKKAVQARRERALDRWIANRARGYLSPVVDYGSNLHRLLGPRLYTHHSKPEYVDKQIDILLSKI